MENLISTQIQILTKVIVESVVEKKAAAIQVFNVEGIISYCDRFVICSGASSRQVRAIADNIVQVLKKEHNLLPLGVEGKNSDKWVLVDFGDIIIHVLTHEARGYYSLEDLWMDAPKVPLSDLGIDDPDANASPDTVIFA